MIGYVNEVSYNYFVKPQYNIEEIKQYILKEKADINKTNQQTITQKRFTSFFNKKN